MPAPAAVLYRRDLLGRIAAAGTPADLKAFGAWSYRGDGALAQETLKAGQGTNATAVERTFGYDGLGRPVSIVEPAMRLDVSYRKDGGTAAHYADGGIAAETVTYHAAGFPAGAVPPDSTTAYGYDAFGRPTGARSAQRPALDVDAAHDGNGNLLSLTQAGESRRFEYGSPAASNKLQKVTRAGTATIR
jgi:YD repeat-containing protein